MIATKFVSRVDLLNSRVDREKGVIRDVSLVSLGEARGHNKFADKITLEQVVKAAKLYPNGLRVRFNANTFNHGDAGLAGFIAKDSIRMVGDTKVVGDLYVYNSFQHKDYLLEMAERAPDNFGLSIEFNGTHEEIDGQTFARCEEIFAATVVDLPAANPTGLFAAQIENEDETMTDEQVKKMTDSITKAIVDGLKPTLEQFRMSQGNTDASEPTPEECAAAGCSDSDTPEQQKSKVMDWRKKANEPVTRKDLLEVFRFAGGKPARVGGERTADEVNAANGVTNFEQLVIKYRATGMKEGKAIMRAREDDKPGYNAWCQKGRPDIKSVKTEAK